MEEIVKVYFTSIVTEIHISVVLDETVCNPGEVPNYDHRGEFLSYLMQLSVIPNAAECHFTAGNGFLLSYSFMNYIMF